MRTQIPLFEKYPQLIYLDTAATAQKPKEVIDALRKFYEESNANVHRGIYTLAQKATLEYETARETIANFIGAQREEIIFTRGTTDCINLLAISLAKKIPSAKSEKNKTKENKTEAQLQKGDEILLTEMEHHSNLVPWQQLAKEKGLVVKFIPITAQGTLNMTAAKELITIKTKIVSLTHISNVLGTINPVQEIAALAHTVGALCIVDAAQSVPHMPVDIKKLGCDFLAFSGHKMCGPTGIGVLWGKKELLEEMEPFHYGGEMIQEVSFTDAQWNEVPWKFEAGTPNIAGVIGLAAAVQFLQKKGMKEIQKHGEDITRYAYKKLRAMSRVQILGPEVLISEDIDPEGSQTPAVRGALVSFTVAGIHPHDVAEICNRYGLAVRAGYQCAMPLHKKLGINGSVRASFYFYTTTKEIDALVQALQDAERIFHG